MSWSSLSFQLADLLSLLIIITIIITDLFSFYNERADKIQP